MTRLRVGVLRGGTSSEYQLSLKSGAAVLAALPEERYETRDIFIDKQGFWHVRGVPATPAIALAQIDVVVSALHGGVGEDGSVGRLLERSGVPYAGSSPLSSALSLNKIRARDALRQSGVRMPHALSFTLGTKLSTADMARAIFSQFPPPYVVKPPSEGSGGGIVVVSSLVELPEVLGDALEAYGAALVEEFIRGKLASVGIIERFRNEDLYVLPPAEIVLPKGVSIFQPQLHEESARHVVPSHFSQKEKRALAQAARAAHRALSLGHFSRADFIVAPHGVYLLEVDSIPALYPEASFPRMLQSVGSSLPEFLEHAIRLARAGV